MPVLMRSTLPRNIDTAINGNINSDAANTNYYVLRGFPVGFVAPSSLTGLEKSAYALYNHVRITVRYHTDPASFEGVRIVGFEVLPFSINHELSSGSLEDVGKLDATSEVTLKTCNGLVPAVNDPTRFMLLDKRNTVDVLYTYDVDWIPSTTAWSDRWDVYLLSAASDEIHVFAIVNSLMIILFLSGIVGMIVCRTLSRDIAGYNDVYNELATLEDGDGKDESGWKLVHNDVFRPPETAPLLLSVFIGSGTQIAASISLTLLLIIMKGHTDKSSTLTAIVLLYVFCGGIGGYYSARCYKLFGGKDWKTNTISTALFFPGCLVCLFSMLNCGLAYEGAGTAVSFGMILSVFLLWVGVSTPLMFVGSYMGFKKDTITVPIKTTTLVPRVIPSDVDGGGQYSGAISILLCGILPFGSVCIELFFIMSSLWLSQIYYVFGFLFIVVLILILTCAEMSIVMTYFQLTHEDYRWWWRSFLGCSSSGMYLFLYSIWYYNSKLDLQGFLSGLVYFTYNAIIALAFALFTGSIGFFSSLIFVRKIYSVIKID